MKRGCVRACAEEEALQQELLVELHSRSASIAARVHHTEARMQVTAAREDARRQGQVLQHLQLQLLDAKAAAARNK